MITQHGFVRSELDGELQGSLQDLCRAQGRRSGLGRNLCLQSRDGRWVPQGRIEASPTHILDRPQRRDRTLADAVGDQIGAASIEAQSGADREAPFSLQDAGIKRLS
jgi:hypothetical protein